MAAFGAIKSRIFDREERKQQYQAHIRGLNAYDRHKKFLNDYVAFYGKEKPTNTKLPVKTDLDTLREGYRFIRSKEDDKDFSWEQRLVKRYYDKLFKEYCIADMSHYKRGKIGLRWRTEKEVMSGKGQFICGNKHCDEKNGLASYEVNFSYVEAGENKQALVKLVTCERCAEKLHYKRRKERELLESKEKEDYKRTRDQDSDEDYEEGKEKRRSSGRKQKEEHKRKREQSWSDDDDTDDECERRTGSERREKEVLKRNRDGSSDDNDRDEVYRGSQEKTKGKKASSSAANPNVDNNDDNFGEFLEGMFP
ncbi:hypothetical protein ACOSP7_018982 [Xanthoceras sorbifolium]